MPKGHKNITWTTKVMEELLTMPGDFASVPMLAKGTNCPDMKTIGTTLSWLRKSRAVDVVIDRDGVGWWFATPETDTRTRIVQECINDTPRPRDHRKTTNTPSKKIRWTKRKEK